MPRTVLLEHRLPGGDWHIDWLLDRDGRSPLLTFRLPRRQRAALALPGAGGGCQLLSIPPPSAFTAERIPDHRRRYLDFEGPISGGRGSVRRIAEGEAEILAETGESLEARVRFGEGPWTVWRGSRSTGEGNVAARGMGEGADLWIFRL